MRAPSAHDFGEAKVRELQVAIDSQDQVRRLQVAEDDAAGARAVKILEDENELGAIESDVPLEEEALGLEVGIELAASDEFEHEVEVAHVLEGRGEGDDEGVRDHRQDGSLALDVLVLFTLHHGVLLQLLQHPVGSMLLVGREIHATERSDAECGAELESVQSGVRYLLHGTEQRDGRRSRRRGGGLRRAAAHFVGCHARANANVAHRESQGMPLLGIHWSIVR